LELQSIASLCYSSNISFQCVFQTTWGDVMVFLIQRNLPHPNSLTTKKKIENNLHACCALNAFFFFDSVSNSQNIVFQSNGMTLNKQIKERKQEGLCQ